MLEPHPNPSFRLPPGIAVPSDGELTRRAHPEPPHPYRSAFARDAARVLHSRAFRRLAGKTQVFARLPEDAHSDHFRSRLTHTLEVTQIARTVAAALGLNTELAEALALAHDIGHPPFGHAGEKALDQCLRDFDLRFDHNLHALRIVTWFEERYAGFRGLNLTLAVREGIVKHSHDYSATTHPELAEYLLDRFPPLEAQLIDLADEIAYLTADLDDGLDSGILTLAQVRDGVTLFRGFHEVVLNDFPAAPPKLAAYETLKRVLNALVTDLMEETTRRVASLGMNDFIDPDHQSDLAHPQILGAPSFSRSLRNGWDSANPSQQTANQELGLEEVRRAASRLAALSPRMEAERAAAKEFLYTNLYNSPGIEEAHDHASQVVHGLFAALVNDPTLLPADHQAQIPAEGLARTVADYIAGMTDSYIEQTWRRFGR
jgi:dGTPase